MTQTIQTPASVANFVERARLSHAENPDRPGNALCGFPVRFARPAGSGSTRCVVCLDLTRSTNFIDR